LVIKDDHLRGDSRYSPSKYTQKDNTLELGNCISKNEALMIIEIASDCLSCCSLASFHSLSERFKSLVSSEYFLTGHMSLCNISSENMRATSINCDFPDEYLVQYADNKYPLIDPLIQNFIKTRDVQYSGELKKYYMEGRARRVFDLCMDFRIINLTFYGIYETDKGAIDGFYFGGARINNQQHDAAAARYLLPFFSIALRRMMSDRKKAGTSYITAKELEVLNWLKEGETSWEISMILKRSERVIGFHVNNILKKLNAMNRAHAVAIALDNNIISM
jgi:DNA-binding CsgD family transcriptional regulator